MSGVDAATEEAAADLLSCCASCGIAEVDDVKLKQCDGCDLVRYCSDSCQELHRPEHGGKCRKRVAELRDEILFKQPESTHLGDCPICCIPHPTDQKTVIHPCCSKLICKGCSFADDVRQRGEKCQRTCPFCRHPVPKTQEQADKIFMKRVAANDPFALCDYAFDLVEEGDYDGAFKCWNKAAGMDNADSHFNLSIMYKKGQGVETDERKELFHLEEAAILGHPKARHKLGCYEGGRNDMIDRAVKHLIIAANLGWDQSIEALKACYKDKFVGKEDFAAALRAHHAAVIAMKSPQRAEAARADAAGEIHWA